MIKAQIHNTQFFLHRPAVPLLIVISGPSGVGKDAVLSRMKQLNYPLRYVTTLTTRPRRASERDNVDYHFVSVETFKKMVEKGELLEWAQVYGNWYGVPRIEVKRALEEGQDTVLKVDVQGALTIKKAISQAVLVFLMPSSMDELLERLKQRHTESSAELELRLKTCEAELKSLPLFDYAVVNRCDEIDLAVADIMAIIKAEKSRVTPRQIVL